MDKVYVNIGIVGTVSSGKTTFNNMLLINQYSDMKIKRTTMVPQVYSEVDGDDFTHEKEEIIQNNKAINSQLLEKQNNITIDDIMELEYYVPKIHEFTDRSVPYYYRIYDTPGLNDSQTKSIYYEYIKNIFHKFDIVIFLVDVKSALNTSDEIDILRMILTEMRKNSEQVYKQHQSLIIIANKCDDMQLSKNNNLVHDEEHQELMKQIEDIVGQEVKAIYPTLDYKIVPMSCENAYIYRMYMSNKYNELSDKYIDKLGQDISGKKTWGRYSPNVKRKTLAEHLKKNGDFNYEMKISGYTYFVRIISNILNKKYGDMVHNMSFDKANKIIESYNGEIDIVKQVEEFIEIRDNMDKHDATIKIKRCNNTIICPFIDKYNGVVNKFMNNGINNGNVETFNTIKKQTRLLIKYFNLPCDDTYLSLLEKLNKYYSDIIPTTNNMDTCLSFVDELRDNEYVEWKKMLRYTILRMNHDTIYNSTCENMLNIVKAVFAKYELTIEEQIDIMHNIVLNLYINRVRNGNFAYWNNQNVASYIFLAKDKWRDIYYVKSYKKYEMNIQNLRFMLEKVNMGNSADPLVMCNLQLEDYLIELMDSEN